MHAPGLKVVWLCFCGSEAELGWSFVGGSSALSVQRGVSVKGPGKRTVAMQRMTGLQIC